MNTSSFLPPPELSSFVSSILVIENFDQIHDFVLPLYANGSPTMVFQTARAYRNDRVVGNLMLYGQTITPAELAFRERFTLIAYFFHPHALKSLFRVSPQELTNRCFDLNHFNRAREINLQEQLLNQLSVDLCLQLINDFIFALVKEDQMGDAKIIFAIEDLKKNMSTNSLSELQKKLNTTERSLQRLFETNVGISPRMFKRICRFHEAFQKMNQQPFAKLTDISYENGFADQSHFIRVFKEFTGITPKEYLKKMMPYNPKF